jgi:hypothetical protein
MALRCKSDASAIHTGFFSHPRHDLAMFEPRCNLDQVRWNSDWRAVLALMQARCNLVEILRHSGLGVGSSVMTATTPRRSKCLQSPIGCEGYLSRKQAAHALGFASEFKIRELERKGMLRSVRGPMRAAFYARPEILALKAQLALSEPGHVPADAWTDADLLALLGHPKRSGEARTALDLVLETQISIERAERVFEFWRRCEPGSRSAGGAARPASLPPRDTAPAPLAPTTHERRGEQRISRDGLIRDLRHPDPRVREQAFAQLKESERA